MIPKIIHYCWFGGKPLSDNVRKYIDTWKRYCPDYKIIEWNENNFDVTQNGYCHEAYNAKKWAFVSDYARLKVLHDYGGFYLDTDVEVVRPLDDLRIYDALSGYESKTHIPTGTIGACRDNEWISMLLENYRNRHFKKQDGSYDQTTNVIVISELTKKKYNIELNGEITKFGENMILLPFDYLCAKSFKTGKILRTPNTYTIHHFSGSWLNEDTREHNERYRKYYKKFFWVRPTLLREKTIKLLIIRESHGVGYIFQKIFGKIFNNNN